MLGKMIRYDLRFGAQKYAMIAVLTAGLLLMAGVGSLIRNEIITGLAIGLAALASVVFVVLYVVISVQHLYTQLCGRESYLSYSLPVSTHTLLLSKLICILFWGFVTAIFLVVFWLIGVEFAFLRPEGQSFAAIWQAAKDAMPPDFAGSGIFTLVGVLMVVGAFQQVAQYAFCVSLVNVPALKERNAGIAAGVVSYLIGGQIIGSISLLIYWLIQRVQYPERAFMQINTAPEITQFLIFFMVFSAIMTVVFYFVAARLVDKHRSI